MSTNVRSRAARWLMPLFVLLSGTASADTIKIGWLSSLTGPLSSAAIAEGYLSKN